MSKALNLVAISGNLTKDPELRSTQGGSSVCSLSVAVNGSEKVHGEWQDRPDYFDVTVFGTTAENAAQWLHKGSHVEISGRLRQDRWQNSEGQNRSIVKIVASDVVFPPKGQGGGGYQSPDTNPPTEPSPVAQDDDIIPF